MHTELMLYQQLSTAHTLVTDKHYDEQEKKKKEVVVKRDDCLSLTFTGNQEARDTSASNALNLGNR